MKKVHWLAQVDENRCIGDKICENVCPPGAIKMINRKASVDEKKCVSCLKCVDVCEKGAIRMVRRSEVKLCEVNPTEVDQNDLFELCRRAHFDPEEPICLCTMTQAKEVAASILKGAHTPEQITSMTGIRSSCGMWCIAPVLRLLRAHGIDLKSSKHHRWYSVEAALWNIPEGLSRKYPEYRLEEDKQLFHEGRLPNLITMTK